MTLSFNQNSTPEWAEMTRRVPRPPFYGGMSLNCVSTAVAAQPSEHTFAIYIRIYIPHQPSAKRGFHHSESCKFHAMPHVPYIYINGEFAHAALHTTS